jgi:hypothetical protein
MTCVGCKERREKAAAALRAMLDDLLAKVSIFNPGKKEIQPPKRLTHLSGGDRSRVPPKPKP